MYPVNDAVPNATAAAVVGVVEYVNEYPVTDATVPSHTIVSRRAVGRVKIGLRPAVPPLTVNGIMYSTVQTSLAATVMSSNGRLTVTLAESATAVDCFVIAWPCEPVNPVTPCEPVKPAPCEPVNPVTPCEPVKPVVPCVPCDPVKPVPCEPVNPMTPCVPCEPVNPVVPCAPWDPVKPITPCAP
jgi:hypothetical protein